MNQSNASMTVIGAGSYGTALAITLARNGHQVVLWGHDPKHIATLEHDRCNVAFLPDVPFPDTLHLERSIPAQWRKYSQSVHWNAFLRGATKKNHAITCLLTPARSLSLIF